ncbi:hypothetical protein Ocin01_18285 [Orchesella cincta]|uniref:Uncharacterized protein n=1 Tax=Orchesella cincta TaxID=48709 RepID=A0A1D2M5Z1_ORCCI|nr:hypothetical protein Ocin01_18285 [Orchesella cincta]
MVVAAVNISAGGQCVVQRVSKTSFVVRSETTLKHQLGYLHIMFFKQNKEDGTVDKKFLCTCKPYKVQQNRDNETQTNTTDGLDIGSSSGVHYHACLCAFARYGFNVGDGIDTSNPMTVEILRENISLMESNAFNTVDDGTLQNVNVQGLEGVLSDQIIVTNVDDSLSFGDASGLDLDDGNSQNAIQLASAFSNSENMHQTVNIANTAVLTSPNSGGSKEDVMFPTTEPWSLHPLKDLLLTKDSKPNYHFHHSCTTTVSPTPTHHCPPNMSSQSCNSGWEFFECLKDRITSGVKKKRLPNQTVIIARTHKPPAGTFTKHVWKLLTYPRPANILQSSGKNDPNAIDNVPFVIEWIPDILPQSKLGELTLIFEYGRSGPREHTANKGQHFQTILRKK